MYYYHHHHYYFITIIISFGGVAGSRRPFKNHSCERLCNSKSNFVLLFLSDVHTLFAALVLFNNMESYEREI